MIARNLRNSPLRALPIAMSILAIAIVWPQMIHPASHAGTDWNDFVRGGVFGLAIGMLLITLMCQLRARRKEDGNSTETSPGPRP
jgi:hypothetical protein